MEDKSQHTDQIDHQWKIYLNIQIKQIINGG